MIQAKPKRYFMEEPQMDFEAQILLGACHYGAADAGEVLAVIARVPSGDHEQWYREWFAIAERLEGIAGQSASAGNSVSARRAYLRAATYFAASTTFLDGTKDPSRSLPTWKRHLGCWESFCAHLNPPAEQVGIPYEGASIPGYFFRPDEAPERRTTIIFNNGSDGATCGMWTCGVAGALERGYNALVFDGPGQNAMLWLKNIPFRHDWERVITPVVDFLLDREDVDPGRIALSGISQGGYWVLRALAFEHRIAAGIVDPAVMDVSESFLRELPGEMRGLLDAGREQEFNEAMDEGLRQAGDGARQVVEWRMRPYMPNSHYQLFKTVQKYNVPRTCGADSLPDVHCRSGRRAVLAGPVCGGLRGPGLPEDPGPVHRGGGRELALRAQGQGPVRSAHVRLAGRGVGGLRR